MIGAKKVFDLILLAIALSLGGCGGGAGDEASPQSGSQSNGWSKPISVSGADINADVSNTYKPQIAFDDSGNAIAIWVQYPEGTGASEVWASRYSSGIWDVPQKVGVSNSYETTPLLAVSANGDAVAVWSQQSLDDLLYKDHKTIWGNRFTKSGGWHGAAEIVDGSASSNDISSVGINAGGDIVVAWGRWAGTDNFDSFSKSYDVDYDGAWVRRYTSEEGWMPSVRLAQFAISPDVKLDNAGNALALFTMPRYPQDIFKGFELWAKRFTPAGGWGEEFETGYQRIGFPHAASGMAELPSLSMNGNGSAWAIWREDITGDNTSYDINVRQYDAAQGWTSDGIHNIPSSYGNPQEINIVTNPNGDVFAIWLDIDAGRRWVGRYTASGGWERISLKAEINSPKIAVSRNGSAIAIWEQYPSAPELYYRVMARVYKPETGWAATTELKVGVDGNASFPQVAMDAEGRGVAIWVQYDFKAASYQLVSAHYEP